MNSYPQPRSIEEAWVNLAVNVLILAIEDVRQDRKPEKRESARSWLLSPAGLMFIDTVMDVRFDVREWVLANCPKLEKR